MPVAHRLQLKLTALRDPLVESRVCAAVQRMGGVVRSVGRRDAADGRVELTLRLLVERRETVERIMGSVGAVAGAVLTEIRSPVPEDAIQGTRHP